MTIQPLVRTMVVLEMVLLNKTRSALFPCPFAYSGDSFLLPSVQSREIVIS